MLINCTDGKLGFRINWPSKSVSFSLLFLIWWMYGWILSYSYKHVRHTSLFINHKLLLSFHCWDETYFLAACENLYCCGVALVSGHVFEKILKKKKKKKKTIIMSSFLYLLVCKFLFRFENVERRRRNVVKMELK